MAVVLIIQTEDEQTTELPLLDKITFGRSSSCDFKINDSKISGQHCKIHINAKGEVCFEDIGSTNGSFLNNSRVHIVLVRINDEIRIGNTRIRIDASKLNQKERLCIGFTTNNSSEDKTLPMLTEKQMKDAPPAVKKVAKKPTVVLNKELLKKSKPPVSAWNSGNENVIEQEESSGLTKMLKIEPVKKKKA